jgi:DNA polymerase-3 subunit delta
MLIYLYGEDTFQSRQYLKMQVDRFKKERDPQGMNVVFLDGPKDAGRIWSEVASSPFLAEKKLVVVQNILSAKDTDMLESLVEGVKNSNLPDKNVVIFWQGDAMGKTKIVHEFVVPVGAGMISWLKAEIASRGGSIAAVALNFLAQNIGKDTWYANSLMDQLVAYANKKEITLTDVQLFLEEKTDDNMFTMVDAIVAGNRKVAFKLLEDQRRLGEDEGYIFSMILRQFRILVSMRDLYNRQENISSDHMAKLLSLHPFVAKKSLPLIKKYPLDTLKNIYTQLLEIDTKTKTGLAEQSWLIDLFIMKLG